MQERRDKQKSVSIFYSYVHQDEKFCRKLETHLSILRQQKLITEWHDRQIEAGTNWQQTIDAHLMQASIILLLISPDFLSSEYHYGVEMQQALERSQKGDAWVIPILLRPTDWENAPFAHLQYLPRNGRPVAKWRDRDEAFVEIARSLRDIISGTYSPLNPCPVLSNAIKPSPPSSPPQEKRLSNTIPGNARKKPVATTHQSITPVRKHSLNISVWLVNFLILAILSSILIFTPFLLSISLFGYTQQHFPYWCPITLCRSSLLTPKATTKPQSIHDANLEISFLSFERNAIVIPDDPIHASPTKVSNEKDPQTISAVSLENSQFSLYHVVLAAHSLSQERYSILIDQISLLLINRPTIHQPLNVWANQNRANYGISYYGINYQKEAPGAILNAQYLGQPGGYTQLIRNETDNLSIQISSKTPVDLEFGILVTYHIATEPKRFTLQVPGVFEVVFSNPLNWHFYQPQSDHFVTIE